MAVELNLVRLELLTFSVKQIKWLFACTIFGFWRSERRSDRRKLFCLVFCNFVAFKFLFGLIICKSNLTWSVSQCPGRKGGNLRLAKKPLKMRHADMNQSNNPQKIDIIKMTTAWFPPLPSTPVANSHTWTILSVLVDTASRSSLVMHAPRILPQTYPCSNNLGKREF